MDKQTKGEPQGESEIRSLARYSPDIRTLKSVKMPTFHFGMLAQAFSLGILGRLLSNPFAAYPGFSMTYFVDKGIKEEGKRQEEGQTSGAVYSPVLKMNFQFILNQLEQEKASWQNERRDTQNQEQDAGFHREPQRAGETENVRERQENVQEFVDHEVRLKRIQEIERLERVIQNAVRMQDAFVPTEDVVSHPSLALLHDRRIAEEQMRQLYEKNMPQTLQRNEYLNELHYLQERSAQEVGVPSRTEEVHQNVLRDVVEGIAAAQIRALPVASLLYRTETERFHKIDNAKRREEMQQLYEKNMPQTLQRNEYVNELRYMQEPSNEEIVLPSQREEVHQNLLRDVVESVAAAQIRTVPISTLLYRTEEERFHKLDNTQRVKEMRQLYEKNMPQTLQRSEYLNELRYLQEPSNEEIVVPSKTEEIHRNLLLDIVESVAAAQVRSMPINNILHQTEEKQLHVEDITTEQLPPLPVNTVLYQTEEKQLHVEDITTAQVRPLPINTILYQTEEERFHRVDNAKRMEEMRQIYEKNMPQTIRRSEYLNELRYLRDSKNEEVGVPSGTEEVYQNLLRDVVENVAAAQIRSLPMDTILHWTEEERFHGADGTKRMEEMRQIYEKNMPQTIRRDEYLNELQYLQDSKEEEIRVPSGTEEVHQNLLRDVVESIAAAQIRSLPMDTILHRTEEERLHKDHVRRQAEMRQIYEKNMPQTLRRDEYINELRYRSGKDRTDEIEVSDGTEDVYRNIVKEIIEETEHTDFIQRLVRNQPKMEEVHELSVLRRFGTPTPVLLQDETPVETPVRVVYARRNVQSQQDLEEESVSDTTPPVQTQLDRDMPDWARDFFAQDSSPQSISSEERAERARIYRQLRERLASRDITSTTQSSWEDPNEVRIAQYGDPDYLPPQDLQYKQVKHEEEKSKESKPVAAYLSESEIRRAADRVYRILEERIQEERRRMGL